MQALNVTFLKEFCWSLMNSHSYGEIHPDETWSVGIKRLIQGGERNVQPDKNNS